MIKTIIFDFAGVLTKENFMPALARLLKANFSIDEEIFRARFKEHEAAYMVDEIDSKIFWKRTCPGFKISYEGFTDAFINAYEWNPQMLDLVKKLKEKYKVVLLSDNFDILSIKLRNDKNLTEIFEDNIFFSNEIKRAKKNVDAFEYVLGKTGEIAEECIFTDDKEKNLIHADALGMKTVHFINVEDFAESLSALGVEV
jgi:putative hydrolase of the HAD superfamily